MVYTSYPPSCIDFAVNGWFDDTLEEDSRGESRRERSRSVPDSVTSRVFEPDARTQAGGAFEQERRVFTNWAGKEAFRPAISIGGD